MMKRDGAPHKLQRFVLYVGGDEFEQVTSGGLPIALNEGVICQLARILGETGWISLGRCQLNPAQLTQATSSNFHLRSVRLCACYAAQ